MVSPDEEAKGICTVCLLYTDDVHLMFSKEVLLLRLLVAEALSVPLRKHK